MLRTILNSAPFAWAVLAAPAALMIAGFSREQIEAGELLHPSGETSARLVIIALMINPLIALIGRRNWLLWLAARRRWLGVAASAYALLHLIFYVVEMGTVEDMLAEFWALGIWTGWAALLLMVTLAATSNDAAMRALRAGWKTVQRLAWPAAALTLVHWAFVHNNLGPALLHFVPLAILFALRTVGLSFRPLQGA